MPEPAAAGWGTCPTCGDATPPGVTSCPSCGKSFDQFPPQNTGKWRLRRLRIHRGLRILLVTGVAIGLIGVMAFAIYQGPPVAADPLTSTWSYHIAPGSFDYFFGAVTGGDYITGNYTVVNPPGAILESEVFNSTEFGHFVKGEPAQPVSAALNGTGGIVDFSAIVTDTYYFVWMNNYPGTSHIAVGVYISTQYMSNVVVE